MVNITNGYALIINNTPDQAAICVLNQVAMLNQLEKLPSRVVLFMLIAFVALLIYIYIMPILKTKWKEEIKYSLVMFSASLLVFAIIIQSALTFDIKDSQWEAIQITLFIIITIWISAFIYKNKNKISELFNGNK
jgi:uncharacterized protein YacL